MGLFTTMLVAIAFIGAPLSLVGAELDLSSLEANLNIPAAEPRPGATSLLEACWGPEALSGSSADRKIYMNLGAGYTPPARTRPRHPLAPLPADTTHAIRYVIPQGNKKLIALTLDLCETATEVTGYDDRVVNILRKHRTPATLFAGGKWLRTHPEKSMQLIADPLFEIGNHTWTHDNLRIIRGDDLLDQILWTQAQYELLRERLLALPCAATIGPSAALKIPNVPNVFRFPYGACDEQSLNAVAQTGLYPIQWNVVTADPDRNQTAGKIVQTVLSQVRPGSIITAHANGRGWHTAEALTTLIPELRKRGYRFVTVSELLLSGQPVAAQACYENQPGDTLRYDSLFDRKTE